MNPKHTTILFAPVALMLGIPLIAMNCDHGTIPPEAIAHVKEAIQDVDVEGIALDHACGIYISKGRDSAEAIWSHEWPIFEPVFKTPPNAATDLQWCTDSLKSLSVHIVSKPNDTSSTSVCGVVAFGSKFEEMSTIKQASTCMHELAHVLGQERMGCKAWLLDYAHVSGRLAAEGTAYALSDAVLARHGVSEADIAGIAKRRAERFPSSYGLSKVVSSECVADYFGDIRGALRERGGV